MVLGIFLLLLTVLRLAPGTPTGRFLHHLMVVRPAAALARIRLGHVLSAATLILTGIMLYWLLQDDGLRMFAMAGSDIIPWLVTFDVSTLLEMAAFALVASAARHAIRIKLPRRFTRTGRQPRSRAPRAQRQLKGDNDNDDEDSRRLAA